MDLKVITTFILLSSSLLSTAQKDSATYKKISWGLSFSPDICYRELAYSTSAGWIKDKRNKEEIPKLGFTLGVNLSRRISQKLSAEAGLLFVNRGERTRWRRLDWADSDNAYPSQTRSVFHYKYLELPLRLNYYVKKSRFIYFISAGISPGILMERKTVTFLKYPNGHKEKTSDKEEVVYSKINFGILLSAGLIVKLNEAFNLRLEPVFRRSLTPVLMTSPDKEYHYSLGLNVGVYLMIKKKKQ